MFTTVAALVAAHPGGWAGPPFWPALIVFPLLFLLLLGLIFSLVFRRRRFAAYGPPWATPHGGVGVAGPGTPTTASAEQILAERFARGEIDETEYRARRDTLRAQ